MNKIYTLSSFVFIASLPFSKISAQTTLEGEYRPRFEFREGFRKPLADTLKPSLTTFQRTRLSLNYKSGILNTRLTMQDSRIWGQSDTKTYTPFAIYEAWAELLLSPGLSATIGRQSLKYDDQRIFGLCNWTNVGQSHDLALLKYKTTNFQVHLGLAYNNIKDTLLAINYTVKQYKNFEFTWLSYDFGKGFNTSFIALNEGLQKTSDYTKTYSRNTIGTNLVLANDSCP